MHENHRDRLKNRFLAEGLDTFEPHNILELLLFYSIPQKDTNETAHLLMEHFGSLSDVFDAPYEELIKIPGIKSHSATLIKLLPSLARRYMLDKNHKDHPLSSIDKIGSYFVDKYLGVNVEVVYLLLLDNKYTAIDCIKIHEGSVNSAAITLRRLVEIALLRNASMVVLAHNHPSGLPIPSPDDLYTTKEIKRAFDLLDIKMLGHILVAGESYINLLQTERRD